MQNNLLFRFIQCSIRVRRLFEWWAGMGLKKATDGPEQECFGDLPLQKEFV